ncbi:MAG: hypothetical protein AAEJ52_14490, partial [Myxococcota bacterium]
MGNWGAGNDSPWRRAVFVTGVACALAMLLTFAWPMFFGKLYVHSDLGVHLPLRYFFSDSLANGWPTLWSPNQFTGFYLHAEGQGVFAHPLNQLQYRFLPLVDAFNLELLRNYVFSLLGTFAFLTRLKLGRGAAAFGAMMFSFCSFNTTHFMHLNFTAIAAHIPWLLLAEDVALRSPIRRNAALGWAAMSLLTASQLLHSHPQVTWMSLLIEGLYAMFVIGPAFASGTTRDAKLAALTRLLSAGAALAVGFLTASIQVIPMLDALASSFRAAPSSYFLNIQTLDIIHLLQLFVPWVVDTKFVFPEFAFYCGAATPVLVCWLILRRSSIGRLWQPARAALGLAAIGTVLSFGQAGLLYRLQEMLPLVGLFRAPARFILLADLGLCIAAAIAFSDLLRVSLEPSPGRQRLWLLLLPISIAVVIAALLLDTEVRFAHYFLKWPISHGALAVGVALTAAATLLVFAAARGIAAACVALVLLTAADLTAYASWGFHFEAAVELDEWLQADPPPPHAPGARLHNGPLKQVLLGERFAGGFAAMRPSRVLPVSSRRPRPDGVSEAAYQNAFRVSSIAASAEMPGAALPRARLVSKARTSSNILADIEYLDVSEVALVSDPIELDAGPAGSVTIVDEIPGRIRLETRSTGRRLLVVAESFHSGWTATIDRKPCPITKVYGDYMGC